ncbi:hypothetical protein [Chitinophaga sp.]|uniref:hypothetical protein n=1 Tax=Chitinophaga sp. TaxID=1869181 RepID=UPI002F94C7FC
MQETIFDDSFTQVPILRRRAVMPLALKIYVWLGMVISGLAIVNVSFQFGHFRALMNSGYNYGMVSLISVIFIMSNAALGFFMTLLLWLEVKWAVVFNLSVGCFWLCCMASTGFFLNDMAVYPLFLPFLVISTPYFILLFVIRKKWTQKAVSGRSLKATA